jgi:hypothetical protein
LSTTPSTIGAFLARRHMKAIAITIAAANPKMPPGGFALQTLGFPMWYGPLCVEIAEWLPLDDRFTFAVAAFEVVPVGADLNAVLAPFLVRLLRRGIGRIEHESSPYAARCRAAVQGVAAWLETCPDSGGKEAAEALNAGNAVRPGEAPAAQFLARLALAAWAARMSAPPTPPGVDEALTGWAAASAGPMGTLPVTRAAVWAMRAAEPLAAVEARAQADDLLVLVRNLEVPA